jgi:hypothetical protein
MEPGGSLSYQIFRSLDPILSQICPVHIVTPFISTIQFNIIIQYTSSSSKWSLSFRCSNYILYAVLISPVSAVWPAHRIRLYLITHIVKTTSYVFPHYAIFSKFSLCPKVFLTTVFPNTLNRCYKITLGCSI